MFNAKRQAIVGLDASDLDERHQEQRQPEQSQVPRRTWCQNSEARISRNDSGKRYIYLLLLAPQQRPNCEALQ